MTDHESRRPRSLFAQKGQAAPAPAVGFVSVRQLEGKPERRQQPDRRVEPRGPDRRFRIPSFEELFLKQPEITDEDTRAALSALAEEGEAPPPETGVAGSALASLIHRHSAAAPPEAAAAPASEAQAPPPERAPTRIDPSSALSAAGAPRRRAPAPSPADAPTKAPAPEPRAAERPPVEAAAGAAAAPAQEDAAHHGHPHAPPEIPAVPHKLRRKLTVRVTDDEFAHIKDIAEEWGTSWQRVVEAAIIAYYSDDKA